MVVCKFNANFIICWFFIKSCTSNLLLNGKNVDTHKSNSIWVCFLICLYSQSLLFAASKTSTRGLYFLILDHFKIEVLHIGNNLKTSKKWNIQFSCNGTIVLTNKEDYKICMFQMLQSQNYGLQQPTKLEGSMCTQKTFHKIAAT